MANWKTPDDLKYQKTDEWLRIEGDTATLGITDYAQDALNDLVFIEYAVNVGDEIAKGTVFGSLESVKAQSDLMTPVSGTVTAVNTALEKAPETVNGDPYDKGWMIRLTIKDAREADGLMDAAAYAAYCETR
ncbi:MAG: glycine cleavage system protein GcvH [bacterium]|nr:glycine cleavage system protein GcvH [bacterium]